MYKSGRGPPAGRPEPPLPRGEALGALVFPILLMLYDSLEQIPPQSTFPSRNRSDSSISPLLYEALEHILPPEIGTLENA